MRELPTWTAALLFLYLMFVAFHYQSPLITIVNNTAPEYLTSRFVRRCDLTSYNLRENEYKLAVPQPRTEFYKRSLSYSGSVLWNSLPLEVRQLTSPSIFKGKLRDIN